MMIYEMRSYWIHPNLVDDYLAWANDKAVPLLSSTFGFRVIGFWRVEAEDGTIPPDGPNVIWMIQWESREARDERWTKVRASPEWAAIREGIPTFARRTGNHKFLRSIPVSPLQ